MVFLPQLPPGALAPARRPAHRRSAAVVTVVLGLLLGLPPIPEAGAQGSTSEASVADSAAPLGLSAPSWSLPDLPAELRLSSLWVLPGPDGTPSAVDVRFAGPFTPPAGRWRVSVGIGDPAGAWQRLSMVWDGTAASGIAQQIEGLSVAEIGPVTATVDPSGSVVVGVPAGVLDASGGGLLWAEAVLGEDTAPTLLVRTPWFPRAVLAGEGSPGLVQGSTLGVPVPEEPGGAAPNAAPPVVDTGVPSVLELSGGQLSVDLGAAPAEIAGGVVRAAVDLVTLAGRPGDSGSPPSGPQISIDLVDGTVELGEGSVLGPLGPTIGSGSVVGSSPDWLLEAASGGAGDGTAVTGPVEVDVAGAFAALGQADPGAGLAVAVTRVVTGADGTVVVAPGVLADRSWLQPGGGEAATPPPAAVPPEAPTRAPWGAILVGSVLGLVVVGGAMVVAERMHGRRHPGPGDDWSPLRAHPGTSPAPVSPPPVSPPPVSPPPVSPPPVSTPPASTPPGDTAVGDLDEDLDELAERLRRLGE